MLNSAKQQAVKPNQVVVLKRKVGVGAMVVPSAGAAVPSIDLSLSANGKNGNQSQAVTNTIAGKNVNVQTQGVLNLQGTKRASG